MNSTIVYRHSREPNCPECGSTKWAVFNSGDDLEGPPRFYTTLHQIDCPEVTDPPEPIEWQYGPEWVARCYGFNEPALVVGHDIPVSAGPISFPVWASTPGGKDVYLGRKPRR